MELPAGDGAPLLETDYPEPDEGSRLTPVGTLEHHGDLKGNPMLTLQALGNNLHSVVTGCSEVS